MNGLMENGRDDIDRLRLTARPHAALRLIAGRSRPLVHRKADGDPDSRPDDGCRPQPDLTSALRVPTPSLNEQAHWVFDFHPHVRCSITRAPCCAKPAVS